MFILVFVFLAVVIIAWRFLGAVYAVSPAFVILSSLFLAWYNGDLVPALWFFAYVGGFVLALWFCFFLLAMFQGMCEALLSWGVSALKRLAGAGVDAASDRLKRGATSPYFPDVQD